MKVLIIGGGIAGLTAAISLFKEGQDVTVLVKNGLSETNSYLAQGGIVYQGDLTEGESQELFYNDMIKAADHLAYPPAVELIAREGPQYVKSFLLDTVGVPFDKDASGRYLLAKEGAHSVKRILYSGDESGRVIMDDFMRYIRENTAVKLFEDYTAVDLITFPHHSSDPIDKYRRTVCLGAYAFSEKEKCVKRFFADKTVLATGGIGGIYKYSTNPSTASGDGIAMAYRAGCKIINMEYTQFHPTALAGKSGNNFLISEAVRGEGAVLTDVKGQPFTENYDKRGSLASRDILSRAIVEELDSSGADHVFLDLSMLTPSYIKKRFPVIYRTCLFHKIDITKEPIPVVPAFHFICGGIFTDLNGQTDLSNLYAAGECACTGVHGANRLASVSLLEGLTMGIRVSRHIAQSEVCASSLFEKIEAWNDDGIADYPDPVLLKQDWATLKTTMWNYAGVIRDKRRLDRALDWLYALEKSVNDFYRNVKVNRPLIELRNGIRAGILVVKNAYQNKKSRGCHYRKN